jgi:hypothetical protein
MNKIIIILAAVPFFFQCKKNDADYSCGCIKKETGKIEIGNKYNIFLTGELIILELLRIIQKNILPTSLLLQNVLSGIINKK